MTATARTRGGGLGLLLGVLIFIGSRFRHHIDPTDELLGWFMIVGFAAWILGLIALRAQYRDRAGALGRAGLATTLAGLVAVTVGHLGGILLGFSGPWFLPIMAGLALLIVGMLLFGVAALRTDVLPRWRAVPLVIGLVGFAWMAFASDSRPVEGNPEAFLVMRTLFGLAWLPLALVLLTDPRGRGASTTEAEHTIARQ